MKKIDPTRRSPALYLSDIIDEVHMDDKHTSQIDSVYVRRTISVAPKINKWIQDLRAQTMKDDPTTEIDYTTVSNYLMAWGINFIQKYKADDNDNTTIEDLVGDRFQLEEQSLNDTYENIFRKKRDVSAEKKSNSNSAKGKKSQDIDEPA